jgi:septum formation protein
VSAANPFVDQPPGEVIILASRSPRRAELLRTAGLPFEVRPPGDVETDLSGRLAADGTSPSRYAEELALAKARDVADSVPGRLVLGADTVVVLDGDILEKPRDEADAHVLLARLAGREHAVISAVALAGGRAGAGRVAHERTRVWFLPHEPAVLARYVATGEPMDKAGAYGIQGLGALLVERLEGCYFNVMGLPLARLGAMLRDLPEVPSS